MRLSRDRYLTRKQQLLFGVMSGRLDEWYDPGWLFERAGFRGYWGFFAIGRINFVCRGRFVIEERFQGEAVFYRMIAERRHPSVR